MGPIIQPHTEMPRERVGVSFFFGLLNSYNSSNGILSFYFSLRI
jgi:hypothetical protein